MSRSRPLALILQIAAILAALLLASLLLAGLPLSAGAQEGLPPQQTPEPITGAFHLVQGPPPHSFGGGSTEPPRDEMSEVERQQLQDEIDRNIAQLTALGRLAPATATAVTFGWPLAPSYNLPDYGYHGVSGFVDHDPAYPDHTLDYTCNDRSYDLSSGYNHAGTDFFIAPFPWLKMARDEVSIVAAAPGVIVYRIDGNYDKNCSISGETWNAVSIRHADGTVASYGHMKRGSVTPKQVGDTVAAGEYLGIVGSSGNSTGPHLHFEVRTSNRQVLDPFHGSCQPEPSLWAQQPAYYDSAVNAVQTADAPPELSPECAVPGDPHVQDSFSRGDLIHFVTYYRDQLAGQESEYTIYEPNGDVHLRWTHSIRRDHYAWSYWYWDWVLDEDAPAGTWRFEVRFEGKSYETTFNYADPAYLALTAPLAAERWSLGSRQLIRWEDNIGGNVRIDLYAAGSYEATIASNTASDGEYEWTVPEDLTPASHYRIRVTDLANQVLLDESDEFAITAEPAADFQATPRVGRYPLTVAFEDLSGGEVESWLWEFGDGSFSTQQNPQHTYSLTGVYKVSLTVSGPLGIDSEIREGYIAVVDGHAVFLPAVGYGAGRDSGHTLTPAAVSTLGPR